MKYLLVFLIGCGSSNAVVDPLAIVDTGSALQHCRVARDQAALDGGRDAALATWDSCEKEAGLK